MTIEPVKFAVVGYGHIGKRHADMIAAHSGCVLSAVVDTNEELQGDVLQQHNTAYYNSLDNLFASGIDVDVINIATPNALHASQAVLCLEKGYHVVIEKPIALTTAESEQILTTAERMDKRVFCVMQNRYSAPMQWLKELMTNNALGNIFLVDVHCYWNRDGRYYTGDTWHGTKEVDGGTLFTQFSHYVDLLYWLFGDITNIQAKFANNNHKGMIAFEDSAIVGFDFVKGGSGSLIYSTSVWDKNMESSMVIVGEKGTVKIGGQYMDKIEYCHIKDYTLPEQIEEKRIDVKNHQGAKANHYFVIQNVLDVLHNGSGITTNAEEGMKVVDIIERIYALKEQ
ncbi:MAG: Gfo/Idh/MocA family oxidoreductase [Chitinophagales bacterium]|nr:Gfo/Idh/MocA family oxidoreductase [Chitinophagaceae bacterium]MCB9065401.1 Gfo/Idh/MocA family oxidoreductase [Chitinophagales bacterium]